MTMGAVPLYRTVYDELKQRILSQEYARGVGLPTESKLGEIFGVSLVTVRRAIQELELDGYVQRRHGVGTFVLDVPREVVVGMSSFTSDVAAGRLRLVRTLLQDEMLPASEEVAGQLGVQASSLVRHLVRLDSEGNFPLSVDEVFMPPSLAVNLTTEMAASPLFVHLWQRASGVLLSATHYGFRAAMPTEDDREILKVEATVPLLITDELILDDAGRPVMLVITRYRGDRSRLSGDVVLAHHTE